MVLPDKTVEAIDKMLGKEYPKYYCQRCGEILQRRGKIKITGYALGSGEATYRAKLQCPKRTLFSHRTRIFIERTGQRDWNIVIGDVWWQ
jgi:hypothetical protein